MGLSDPEDASDQNSVQEVTNTPTQAPEFPRQLSNWSKGSDLRNITAIERQEDSWSGSTHSKIVCILTPDLTEANAECVYLPGYLFRQPWSKAPKEGSQYYTATPVWLLQDASGTMWYNQSNTESAPAQNDKGWTKAYGVPFFTRKNHRID